MVDNSDLLSCECVPIGGACGEVELFEVGLSSSYSMAGLLFWMFFDVFHLDGRVVSFGNVRCGCNPC